MDATARTAAAMPTDAAARTTGATAADPDGGPDAVGRTPDDGPAGPVRTRPLSSSTPALLEEAARLGPDPTLGHLDDEALVTDLCGGAAELAAATCRWLVLLGEVVVRGLWATDGASTPGTWLSWRLGIAPSTAREHVRVALRLRELGRVRARFARGTLSYSKVRAITRVADRSTEGLLLRWADAATAAELDRIVRDSTRLHRACEPGGGHDDLGLRTRWRDDGTFEAVLRLDAADGLAFEQRVERLVAVGDLGPLGDEVAPHDAGVARDDVGGPDEAAHGDEVEGTRPHWPARAADALLGAVATAVADGPLDTSGLDRHLAVVEVAAADLASVVRSAPGDASAYYVPGRDAVPLRNDGAGPSMAAGAPASADPRDGSASAGAVLAGAGRAGERRRPIPLPQLRRLLCTTGLDVVVAALDRHVDLGRSRRDPDARLRRLLTARDRTCRFPGCGSSRWLHAHHVVPWTEGGRTDLDNLVLLCGSHHRLVHGEAWLLRPLGAGRWTFHRAGGADRSTAPSPALRCRGRGARASGRHPGRPLVAPGRARRVRLRPRDDRRAARRTSPRSASAVATCSRQALARRSSAMANRGSPPAVTGPSSPWTVGRMFVA